MLNEDEMIAHALMLIEAINETTTNSSKYSPIKLNEEWPSLWRMLFMMALSFEGTILNGFFLASFFIEPGLCRSGLVYLAFCAIADMVITSGILPGATTMLISKMESLTVCYIMQFFAQGAIYLYNMSFAMVAVETYYYYCHNTLQYIQFTKFPAGLVSTLFTIIAFTVSGFGVWYQLDYDYCAREIHGNYTFRLATMIIFQAIPFTIAILYLVSAALVLRVRAYRLVRYRKSKQYALDFGFTKLHMCCFLFHVLAWLPYLIIVNKYPLTSDAKYYNFVWLGLARSFLTSVFYTLLNKDFRQGFVRVFLYCFCKRTISPDWHNHRYGQVRSYRSGRVHSHILHHSLPVATPKRVVTGCLKEAFCLDI